MSNLVNNQPRQGAAGLFVLRLAVAGILAWAGWNQFRPETRPPLANLPADTAVVAAVSPAADPSLPAPGPEHLSQAPPQAAVSRDGVKLNLGWDTLVGAGEIGVGAALMLGLLVRLVSFLGAGTIAAGAVATQGWVDLPSWCDPLVQSYQANPAAALLLGAIFLALLVGGSGPIAADRTLEHRRRLRKESLPAPVTA